MAVFARPVAKSVYICDDVVHDPHSGKVSLLNLWDGVHVPAGMEFSYCLAKEVHHMNHKDNIPLVEFECVEANLTEGTPAVSRPAAHPRVAISREIGCEAVFQSFDCVSIELPPDTKAEIRPPGHDRRKPEIMPPVTDLPASPNEQSLPE